MPLTGTFGYVRIPADEGQPIETVQADKSGGLQHDALVKQAKAAFHELTGSKARAQQLEQASPTERRTLAAQIRQQMQGGNEAVSKRLDEMEDDAVLEMLYRSQVQPSCDITALTVPTRGNGYTAVSMYAADNAGQHGLPLNARATALLTACGHAAMDGGIYGDVFVGRAHDDEAGDVWERVDFSVADADPSADWCRVARSPGGGGGSGKAAAASLSSLAQQHASQAGGVQVIDSSSSKGGDSSLFGLNGAPPVQDSWGSWTQTDDEVELKFGVAQGTKTKYCKVIFGQTSLKVAVAGQTLLQGQTFDPVVADECTFTLQDEGPTGRELCVTLSKKETGRTWAWVAR